MQPKKQVAPASNMCIFDANDGASYAGLVKAETDDELAINLPEAGLMTLKKTDIKSRLRGLSAMPEELATYFSRRELRDLIEFLANVK